MNMQTIRRSFLIILATVAALLCLPGSDRAAAADDLLVIVNPDNAMASIESKDLQRIYLGKKTMWEDGSSIVTVMPKDGTVHDMFIEDYLDRSVQRFATYWRQMVFTGKGVPPKSFVKESDLVEFVARTPGSVGFASTSAVTTEVRVITVD
jgi:ABC-type phosphate transport system substrate-binding protein